MINFKYKLKDSLVKELAFIDKIKIIFKKIEISSEIEKNLKRQAIVRMVHNSTAIEGNKLSEEQVGIIFDGKRIDAQEKDICEVKNYLNVLKYINQFTKKKKIISEKVLLKLHRIITNNVLSEKYSGVYRKEPVFIIKKIFGIAVEVVYRAPSFKKVPQLSNNLMAWINESEKKKINPIIVAGIVHHEIAAIHPFIDGNGRTARAMATLILYQRGYDFRKLLSLEDYYNNNRNEYYDAINIGKSYERRKKDNTLWLEYFIKGFREEAEAVGMLGNSKEMIQLHLWGLNSKAWK